MTSETGKWIIIIGIILLIIGVIIYFFHDYFKWVGHLPGDISVRKENFSFYFPLTTMIIFSILLTVIIRIVRRFL